MAPRLLLVAHAATPATRHGAFPLDEHVERPDQLRPVALRAAGWLSGPETRCRQTAAAFGWPTVVEPGLADLDAGQWAGRGLTELMSAEPESLLAWMSDVDAAPPGGESLVQLISRVGAVLDGRSWPDGLSVVVVAPLVIRAAVVHLLGAPATLVHRIDVEPLSATELTGHGGRWKLRTLQPWPTWCP